MMKTNSGQGVEQYAVSPSLPEDTPLRHVLSDSDCQDLTAYLNRLFVNAGELTAYQALTVLCCIEGWDEGEGSDQKFLGRVFDELLNKGVMLDHPKDRLSPLKNALDHLRLPLLKKMEPYLNAQQKEVKSVLVYLSGGNSKAVNVFRWALDHILVIEEQEMCSVAMFNWHFFEIALDKNPTWNLSGKHPITGSTLLMALFFANDMSAEQLKGWIDRLLEAGVDIDAAYTSGTHYTVLFVAANYRPQWLSYLIQKGANPYLLDHRGNNFIHTLMSSSPLGALFLENDMGLLNEFNENGYTPLHSLSEYMDKHTFQRDEFVFLLEWALRCGGDFSIKGKYNEEPWVDWVLHNPSSLQDWINRGMRPLLDVKGETLAQLLYQYPEGWKGLDILLDHGIEVSLSQSVDRIQPENLAWWERRQLQGQTAKVSASDGEQVSRL